MLPVSVLVRRQVGHASGGGVAVLLKQVWPYEGREVGVAVMCEVGMEEDDLNVVEILGGASDSLRGVQSPNSGWLYTQCGQYQGTDAGIIRRKAKRSTHHPSPQSDNMIPQMPSLLQHEPHLP